MIIDDVTKAVFDCNLLAKRLNNGWLMSYYLVRHIADDDKKT